MANNIVEITVRSVDESTQVFQDISAQANETFDQAEQSAQGLNDTIEQEPNAGASVAMQNTEAAAADTQGAIDDASGSAASFSDKLKSGLGKANEHWQSLAAGAGAMGGVIEGLARKQGDLTETTEKVASATDLEADAIRDTAAEVSNAYTDHGELVNIMETGAQQGLESADALGEYSERWEMIGSATGENAEELAQAGVALERVGISAENEGEAMAAFGYITEDTTQEIGDMLHFIDRSGDEIEELGLTVDDTAALMGVLEEETGATGRTARQDLRQAMNETDGSMEDLLETLGISEEAFKEQQQAVKNSGDVIEEYNDINEDNKTIMEEVTQNVKNFAAKHGEAIQILGNFAPLLMGLVPAMKGLQGAFMLARGAASLFNKTLLMNPIFLVISALTALGVGLVAMNGKWEQAGEVMSGFFSKISEFISSTVEGIMENLPQMVNAFIEGIQNIITAIMENLPMFAEKGREILMKLIEGARETFPQLLEMGMNLIVTILEGVAEMLPQFAETAVQLIQTLSTKVTEMLPEIMALGVELLTNLINGLTDALPVWLEAVITIMETLVETITGALPEIINMGIEILTTLIEGIVNTLPQLIEAALSLITNIVETLVGALPEILNAGIQILMELIDGILQLLPELISAAIDLITAIAEALLNNLPMILNAGLEIVFSLIDGIIQMLPELIGTAIDLIIEISTTLISELPTIIEAGIDILLALIDGLIQTIPELVGAIPEIVDAIFQAFADVDWMDIGKEIISGIGDGLTNFAGDLVKKGKQVAEDALGGIKGFLGISSPSKEGIWLGEMLGIGLGGGIEDQVPSVLKKSQEMAAAALPKVESAQMPDMLGGSAAAPEVRRQRRTGESIKELLIKIARLLEGDDDPEGKGNGSNVEIPIILNRREIGRAMSDEIDYILRDKTSSATRSRGL